MKDWKAIARASRPGIPGDEIERIVPVLEALERKLLPLAETLEPGTEPALVFRASGDGE